MSNIVKWSFCQEGEVQIKAGWRKEKHICAVQTSDCGAGAA